MLTYTGGKPFKRFHDDEPMEPGATVSEDHPHYAYLSTRGDFAATPSRQESRQPTPEAPATTEPKPKRRRRKRKKAED